MGVTTHYGLLLKFLSKQIFPKSKSIEIFPRSRSIEIKAQVISPKSKSIEIKTQCGCDMLSFSDNRDNPIASKALFRV